MKYLTIYLILLIMTSGAVAEEKLRLQIPPISQVIDTSTHEEAVSYEKSDPVWNSYFNAVQNKVSRFPVAWPLSSSGEKVYGRAQLNLVISTEGQLIDVYPAGRRDGDDDVILTQTAINQVKGAAPFLAPPWELIKNHKSLRLPMSFSYMAKESEPLPYGPSEHFRMRMQGGVR